jgi:hypothetical protein
LIAGYIACFWTIRLIVLTLTAYTFVRSGEKSIAMHQKIGDAVASKQVLTYGFSALCFACVLHGLQPLTRTRLGVVFDRRAFKACFPANGLGGAIIASVMIIGSMLGGHMRYLGVYVRFDEVVIAVVSASLFGTALFTLALVEEYVMRAALEPPVFSAIGPLAGAAVSCLIYLTLKYIQFDMNPVEAINFVLLNLTLSMIARQERSFTASASFLATFLTLSHVVLGLPFMGQDIPGIFLLRGSNDNDLGTWLSGGAEGPEAGLVLTVLLVIYLYLPQIRSKKVEV